MLRVAAHFGRHAVFDGDEQGAGIGAVVGAGGADLGDAHLNQFQEKNVEKPILYPIPAGFVADRSGGFWPGWISHGDKGYNSPDTCIDCMLLGRTR